MWIPLLNYNTKKWGKYTNSQRNSRRSELGADGTELKRTNADTVKVPAGNTFRTGHV